MAIRILHCHSTFSLGGKEARAVRLMNAFGDAAEHVVLSAMPDRLGAREAIDKRVTVEFPTDAPSLQGKPGPIRYWQAGALHAPLRSRPHLQLGIVRRGDGAACCSAARR